MKDVKPFIDLGFYVVPLEGTITRLSNGKKKLPRFPNAWKEVYLEHAYDPEDEGEDVAKTGAFITGIKSGAVSIDCDNQATYDIFKALDPEYGFHFVSNGKKEGGGSIGYRLNKALGDLPSFRIKVGVTYEVP